MVQNGPQNLQKNHFRRHSVRKRKQTNRERLNSAVCLFYIEYTLTNTLQNSELIKNMLYIERKSLTFSKYYNIIVHQ